MNPTRRQTVDETIDDQQLARKEQRICSAARGPYRLRQRGCAYEDAKKVQEDRRRETDPGSKIARYQQLDGSFRKLL